MTPNDQSEPLARASAEVEMRSGRLDRPDVRAAAALPPFVGRNAELTSVTGLSNRVTVVVGDSGIGKSHLLRTAARWLADTPRAPLAPAPVQLAHRPGALQVALLDALAAAIADLESSEGRVARWGRIFATAAAKAADARVRDMVTAAGGFILGAIRARLGDDFADVVESIGGQLRASQDEQLAARIATASDPDALAAFCLIATEARELAAKPIVLSIDRAERLPDEDFRYMLDLFEQIPEDIHLVVAHSSRSPEDTRRVRLIKESVVHIAKAPNDKQPPPTTADIAIIHLAGLAPQEVATWMGSKNLDTLPIIGGLEEVMRVTAGYPLYVDIALAAIERGDSLGELSGEEGFIARTQQNYAGLDLEDQRCAMLLAAFSDPPAEQTVLDLLELDRTEWAVRERRLEESHILVTSVDGDPWFHELGRRAIWEHVLTGRQRSISAQQALAATVISIEMHGGANLSTCLDMAKLCEYAPDFVRQNDKLAEFIELDANELAVFAALDEITEDTNKGASHMGPVISYARNRFGASGDLVAVIRNLAERGLIVIAEADRRAVIIAAWGSNTNYQIAIGRMALVLNRLPIRSIASRVFNDFLLPTVAPFHVSLFGLGRPSVTKLSRGLQEEQYERGKAAVQRHDRPGLILRPRLGELDLYGAVNFETTADRDRAFEALAGLETQLHLLGERFILEFVHKWPHPTPLAALRFAHAIELATGENFTLSSSTTKSRHLPAVATLDDEMDLRVRMLTTIRDLSSPIERLALGVERGQGVVFLEHTPGLTVADVSGLDRAIRLDPSMIQHANRYPFIEIERLANLGPGEVLGTITTTATAIVKNPIPGMVADTYKRFNQFNTAQRRHSQLEIPGSEEEINAMLANAQDQRLRDAAAFVASGVVPAPANTLVRTQLLLIIPGGIEPPTPFGSGFGGLYSLTITDGRANSTKVRIIDSASDLREGQLDLDYFARYFSFDKSAVMHWNSTEADLSYGIAGLLGQENVRLPAEFRA